jgi:hypothetical protein
MRCKLRNMLFQNHREVGMMKTYCNSLVMAVLLLILTGCASLLPSSTITTKSPWENFDGAKLTYDKVIPGVTTVDSLKKLGFDPFLTPNIKILNVKGGFGSRHSKMYRE